jgi:hypothetical protein
MSAPTFADMGRQDTLLSVRQAVLVWLVSSASVAFAAPSLAIAETVTGETPYLYQRAPRAGELRTTVELESAVGTRDARPFGERGAEEALRVELRAGRVTVSARGGVLFVDGDRHAGASGELGVAILDQHRGDAPITLRASAALIRDYREDTSLRLAITGARDWARVNVTASAIGEKPFAEDRDTVDVIVGAAASVSIARRARLGAEIVGEDLEDAWEDEEAEGGARLLVGPTLWVAGPAAIELRANAAWASGGFLGRLVIGRSF